jgi:hypothetical protein
MDNTSKIIRALYRGEDDGYGISKDEKKAISESGGNATYGELTPRGFSKLLRKLDPKPSDVFYDLGSGTGKVVLQMAMSAPLKRCVGYELSSSRSSVARSRLRLARQQGHIQAKRTAFYTSDFMEVPMKDATLVYACATAFSNRFMLRLMRKLAALPKPITFVSLRVLDDHKSFVEEDEFTLHTSWDTKCPAYVYRTTP